MDKSVVNWPQLLIAPSTTWTVIHLHNLAQLLVWQVWVICSWFSVCFYFFCFRRDPFRCIATFWSFKMHPIVLHFALFKSVFKQAPWAEQNIFNLLFKMSSGGLYSTYDDIHGLLKIISDASIVFFLCYFLCWVSFVTFQLV